ncbi:unnamed protein product [Mytilus coruscus]|uniref:Reverse transcriptase/retrotransposon-derived protein RNase H-like domain-containing protein n=1 Tax=Mytilus coruscus TaxID=42192 RepID=A0A6J8CMZ8_MYTCO|nr:unnamed protein product [Mytilus coruscus]
MAPIGDDLLLGCDVIDEKDITINTKRGLEIQGVWIDCDVQKRSDNVARILLKETVTIPPNSEVILEGHGINCETIDTRYGSIEPVIEDERKILVARCLVDPFQDNIPVRLVNLDSSPVKIRKNFLLGEIHPVIKYDNFVYEDRNSYNIFSSTDGLNNWVEIGKGISRGDVIEPPNIPDDLNCFKVSSLDTINNGVQANTPKLPDHLKDLYEKSCVKLSNSKDKLKLAEVLIKNQNAFAKNKTDLGHVVSKNGVHPNPKIVESVKKWKTPSNIKEVQQFIGLCNYYRQFILKFSEVASPLSRLTRKDVPFVWNPECQTAFENLKNALCKAPVLSYPLPNIPFILDNGCF